MTKHINRAASSCHVAAGRDGGDPGWTVGKNQWSPLNNLQPVRVRLKHNSCLSAYIRIARMLHQRHHIAIVCGGTPARNRSPAKPARNAWGETSATFSRTARSSGNNAARKDCCSHAFRCTLDITLPRTGAKTVDSPAASN